MKAPVRTLRSAKSAGVTLIELIIVIAITGILAALIATFIMPVRSYFDTSKRAALADAADTALRRIGRDLRLALPNSVRIGGGGKYVEFLLVRTGGRYRYEAGSGTDCGGAAADDALSFSAADTCFTTLGSIPNAYLPAASPVALTDHVVVFNLPPGTDKADAYQHQTLGTTPCGAACNKAQIASPLPSAATGGDRITFASNTFTYESPGRRFFIIEGAVTYGCSGTTLTRYSGYGINHTQIAPPTGGSIAILATNVNDCSFAYDASLAQGAGLVTMRLQLRKQISGTNEDVNLYHAVHVNNVP